MRLAAIDIGSNAIRLLIEEVIRTESQNKLESVMLSVMVFIC